MPFPIPRHEIASCDWTNWLTAATSTKSGFSSGNEAELHVGAYEVVEEKPVYDAASRRLGNSFVQAGNGGDDDQPWTGRSVRIGFINASRGVGCFLESLAHGHGRHVEFPG